MGDSIHVDEFTMEDCLEGVRDVAIVVAARQSVPQIVGAIAEGLRLLPGDPAISIGVTEGDAGPVRLVTLEGFDPTTLDRWGTIPRTAKVPLTDVLVSGEALYLESLEVFLRNYPALEEEVCSSGHQSWVALPLVSDVGASGVVGMAWAVPKSLSDSERVFLTALSKLGGEALRRASRDIDRHELALRLSDASDDDRAAIARDLHDHAVQRLAAASIRLGSVRADLIDPHQLELASAVSAIEEEVQAVISTLRDVIVGLNPPDLVGLTLAEAVDDLVDWVFVEPVDVRFDDRLELEMREPEAVVAYQVICEALSNVSRHARANRVDVQLRRLDDDQLLYVLTVADNGVGLSSGGTAPRRGHLGLQLVRHRVEFVGGTFDIHDGNGLCLEARLPLPERLRRV